MKVETLQIGEFRRLVKESTTLDIGVKKVNSGFMILAISKASKTMFAIRHAREDKPRTWRLDRAALVLESIGIRRFEVVQ